MGIRGTWQPQVEALFDIKVIDTDAPSHRNHSPEWNLKKRRKGFMNRPYLPEGYLYTTNDVS